MGSDVDTFGIDTVKIRGDLIQGCGAVFEDRRDFTLCHIQGLHLIIRDAGDLFLTAELFRGCSYPIPFNEPCIVFDVGMNVGMAALQFASSPYVERVYSFEPFPRTFELAVANCALNPTIMAKIHPHCFGLATANESRLVTYSEKLRGSMTTQGVPPCRFSPGIVTTEAIELRDIVDVFSPILAQSSQYRRILKMDCEGDEYTLIPRLEEQGLLKVFDFIMIEFHYQGAGPILDILERNDFFTTSATRSEQILFHGKEGNMIYASKNQKDLD